MAFNVNYLELNSKMEYLLCYTIYSFIHSTQTIISVVAFVKAELFSQKLKLRLLQQKTRPKLVKYKIRYLVILNKTSEASKAEKKSWYINLVTKTINQFSRINISSKNKI